MLSPMTSSNTFRSLKLLSGNIRPLLADLTHLRAAGYDKPFKTVQEGTKAYMLELLKKYP